MPEAREGANDDDGRIDDIDAQISQT